MPIRKDLRPLYPSNWKAISHRVRFERERGVCQGCGRRHGQPVHVLEDGRHFDFARNMWVSARGNQVGHPMLHEFARARTTYVWLSCCHLDNDPRNNEDHNLAALCQACHLRQDLRYHIAQRKITHLQKRAMGDLFLGEYVAGVTCTGK